MSIRSGISPPPTKRISIRSIRTLLVLILFVSISLLNNNNNTELSQRHATAFKSNSTSASESNNSNHNIPEKIKLCGHTINNLPYIQPTSKYGMTNWNRTLNNAIVLDHRVEHIHGRTGNQIRAFFHAFDYARDHNNVALVIHTTGYPMDSTLSKLYLGLDVSSTKANQKELENRLGILFYNNIDIQYQTSLYSLSTRWARDYVSPYNSVEEYTQYDMIQHRHYIIQQLYYITSRVMIDSPKSDGVVEMCKSYHAFFGDKDGDDDDASTEKQRIAYLKSIGITKPITTKYTIIHSRSFEGKQFLEESHRHYGVDPTASVDYPPNLISSILKPLDMMNNTILMITDGQNKQVIDRLQNDPIIGKNFVVVPDDISTMSGDIMLGILSSVFIGNPSSSFSQYITQVRYALGIDKSYLYVRRRQGGGSSNSVGDDDKEEVNYESFCEDESCFYYLHDLEAQTHQPSAPKTV